MHKSRGFLFCRHELHNRHHLAPLLLQPCSTHTHGPSHISETCQIPPRKYQKHRQGMCLRPYWTGEMSRQALCPSKSTAACHLEPMVPQSPRYMRGSREVRAKSSLLCTSRELLGQHSSPCPQKSDSGLCSAHCFRGPRAT